MACLWRPVTQAVGASAKAVVSVREVKETGAQEKAVAVSWVIGTVMVAMMAVAMVMVAMKVLTMVVAIVMVEATMVAGTPAVAS